jgi:hypothetical protein
MPALQYVYRQLETEPWREEAHRLVIKLLTLDGQRSAAGSSRGFASNSTMSVTCPYDYTFISFRERGE